MFSFNIKLHTAEEKDLLKLIDKFKKVAMNKAIRVFLKACLAKIPTRTGFLKGAFSDINRLVGGPAANLGPTVTRFLKATGQTDQSNKIENVKIGGGKKSKGIGRAKGLGRVKGLGQEFYYDGKTKVLKTPESGGQYLTPPGDVLIFTENSARFNLNIAIAYYRVNDFYSRITGSPWGSLEAGKVAMLASLQESIDQFPKLVEACGTWTIALRDGEQLTSQKLTSTQ